MLATAETIEMIANMVIKHTIPALVVDPVMVSTSGAQLLPHEAIQQLSQHLLPLTTLLTPNIPEAALILGVEQDSITCVADLEDAGRKIRDLGPKWVLVKGGHLPFGKDDSVGMKKVVIDVLVGPEGVLRVESPWQDSMSTHGTGCSLACKFACVENILFGMLIYLAAVASGMAKGQDIPTAVKAACRYIEAGIRSAPKIGGGHGPLNHFHSTYTLPFSPSVIPWLVNPHTLTAAVATLSSIFSQGQT